MKKILYTGDVLIIPYGLNKAFTEFSKSPDKYKIWRAPFPPDRETIENFDLTIVHFREYPSIIQVMNRLDKDNESPVVFTRPGIEGSDINTKPNCYIVDDDLLMEKINEILG